MATLLSVKEKALRRVGVLGNGQTVSPLQDVQVTSAYNSLYDELQSKSIAAWAQDGDIPDTFVEHIVDMLSFNLANEFGVSDSRWQRLQITADRAELKLRAISYPNYVSDTEVTDY